MALSRYVTAIGFDSVCLRQDPEAKRKGLEAALASAFFDRALSMAGIG